MKRRQLAEDGRSRVPSLALIIERDFEAGAGIEPANSGFADRDLTTWLPRRLARADNIVVAALVSSAEHRIDRRSPRRTLYRRSTL